MKAASRVAGFIALMLSSGQILADYQLDMSPGVTSVSQGAYEIHTFVMWISVVIAIVVFGAMTYAIFYHRKSR
ncbi:MAG: cytochrome c oxidase subunit II, partial [Gammaproteobacteria bacterium]|nr:cytochrome c oxidase subunit II [Gammaproteobacteria bacterium]